MRKTVSLAAEQALYTATITLGSPARLSEALRQPGLCIDEITGKLTLLRMYGPVSQDRAGPNLLAAIDLAIEQRCFGSRCAIADEMVTRPGGRQ